MDLAEVLGVFANPHTEHLHDRQLAVLRRLVKDSEGGFRYRQLPDVCKLLDFVWARVEDGNPAFVGALVEVVVLCGLPVIRDKSNEEFLGGLAHLERLVATLERFLHVPLPSVQVATCEALREVSMGNDALRTNDPPMAWALGAGVVAEDLRPLPRDLNQGILLRAGVVGGLAGEVARQVGILAARMAEVDALRQAAAEASQGHFGGGGGGGVGLPEGGFIRTRPFRDDDDEEEDSDGAAAAASAAAGDRTDAHGEVAVRTSTLKAELVSAMPADMRELLVSLMGLLREISGNAFSSAEIVKAGGTGVVCDLLRLLVPEPRDPLINACVEVLWNCLEHSQAMLELGPPAACRTALVERRRKANAMYAMSTTGCLGTLRDLLVALLESGHRAQDKELRNEVLIVASFVARQRRSHALFRTTGLLDVLLAYATAAETQDSKLGGGGGGGAGDAGDAGSVGSFGAHGSGSVHLADLHNFATVQPADLELKRILWALLSSLARTDPLNLAAVVDSRLLEVLLMYLNVDLQLDPASAFDTVAALSRRNNGGELPGSDARGGGAGGAAARDMGSGGSAGGDPASPAAAATGGSVTPLVIRRLPRTQLRVLQQQSMSVLLNLAPRAPDKFKALAGHIITLRFLDACSAESGVLRGLVQGALMLLLSFVGLPGLQEELGQLDAVRIMLARFNDGDAPAGLRADAVCILSRLCSGHAPNQTTFRQVGGIVSLVHELEAYARGRQPAPRERRAGGGSSAFGGLSSGSASEKVSPLVVGVVDCLWNGAVGNKRSEARLLSVQGMEALLNMLEVCPVLMRHQIAGLVADLCENPTVVPYVKAWKSDRTMVGAVELLMHVFEDEEVRLAFDRPDGIIANLWEPLRRHAGPDGGSALGGTGGSGGAGSGGDGEIKDGGGGGGDGGSSASGGGGAPKKFARLASALQQSPDHQAERALRRAIETQDLRAKITAIVTRIGFEYAAEGLSAPDRATLLMAVHYVEFRAGEAWRRVRRELLVEGTKPIAADSYLLEAKIEAVFASARAVKCEQMALAGESRGAAAAKEAAFLDTVLQQRDQALRLEQLRRSALAPRSAKKRAAEAAARASAAGGGTAGAGGAGGDGGGAVETVLMQVSAGPEVGPEAEPEAEPPTA